MKAPDPVIYGNQSASIVNRLLFLIFLSLSVCATAQVPTELLGTWKGDVIEPGRSDWYPVVITVTQGGVGEVVASVFYPAYTCGGDLKLLHTLSKEGLVMQELLTEGVFSCINNGQVEIRLVDDRSDRVHFKWSHASYNHEAIGILDKQEI